jgi:hypothetical protein
MSRGDRVAAIQHLSQLAQHAPVGINRTRALVLTALAQLDGGDSVAACQKMTPDLHATASADVSVGHLVDSVSSLCATRAAAATAIPDTAVRAGTSRDTAKPTGPVASRPAAGQRP